MQTHVMKKLFKFLGITLVCLLLIIGGLVTYVKTALPNVGAAPEMKVSYAPDRVERGKYLAWHVNACMDCHSTRDWSLFSGPLMPGTLGKGGERFDQQFGFPGAFFSRNITPSGIANHTDGELFRAITTGVTSDGKAMFPVMPYPYYGKMDPDDIQCIIAYLRSLQPIENVVPASKADFPMSVIMNLIPQKAQGTTRPDKNNTVAYGAYLTNAAGCIECHTPVKSGQIIRDLAFTGGREFPLPTGGIVRSANITPDMQSGIGKLSSDDFVKRFKIYADSNYHPQQVTKGTFNTIMPWTMYAGMTETDLAAIYAYLHSLPARPNTVIKFSSDATAGK